MSGNIIALMVGVSLFLGLIALTALLWGLRSGQFDDSSKFTNGALFDGEDELNDAVELQRRKEESLKKREGGL